MQSRIEPPHLEDTSSVRLQPSTGSIAALYTEAGEDDVFAQGIRAWTD
jgi:hypothetical protein